MRPNFLLGDGKLPEIKAGVAVAVPSTACGSSRADAATGKDEKSTGNEPGS